ncbi:ion channel [Tenacibaculum aiptasiae]|uniref:ion channel n=1 Tax=Tenacibaculum aiptasiae TaxID=426481 RepID=UPI003B5CF108
MKDLYKTLYEHRFETFFFSLLAILFGSLLFPVQFFQEKLMPILFLINIAAGIILISKKKKLFWFFVSLFTLLLFVLGLSMIQNTTTDSYMYVRLGFYFLFYTTVTIAIIKQVWNAKNVNKNVIIGLMSGYISLGLIAFLMFLSVEISNPGSFGGILLEVVSIDEKIDSLLYYAYITLLTIGYGEIIPLTPIAQKASILTGLMGQFYIVIITAVVVEKYIRHSVKN